MTKYSYLLKKKESGELSILFELGLPVNRGIQFRTKRRKGQDRDVT